MKKLMTVLASAATALFAIGVAKGDGFTHKAGFESYEAGQKLDLTLNDSGENASPRYWYTSSAEDAGDISNHVGEAIAEALIPDGFESEGSKYLRIDTSAPLFRHVSAETEGATATPVDIGDGIYLDTLVQFTAADDEFQADLDDGDKIAISYVEHEDDDTTTEVNEAWTNFVIRAGQIVQGVLVQKNYFAAVPAGFNKEDWHRLTVRSIKLSDTQAAFIIYLDGDMTKALSYSTDVDAGFGTLTSPASDYYNTERHALYPSAVGTGDNITTISAVSFSGTGALDDVVFTATKPSFIQEAATVTIKWDAGFTAVSIDGTAVTSTELAAGTKTVTLSSGTVLVTYTLASGYEAGTFVGTWDSTVGGFTGVTAGAVLELKSLKANFDVGGTHYDKIADAIAAAVAAGTAQSPATIKLLADYAGDIELSDAGYIVIDLAGKDINGAEYGINNSAATLTIINSTETIGHVTGVGGAVMIAGGSTTINNGIFDAAVVIDTETFELKLLGGQFLNCPEEIGDTNFYLSSYVDSSVTATAIEDNYFQVGEGGEQPETFALTTTGGANATVTTDPDDVSALTEATQVTITATPNANYTYNGVDLTNTGFTYDSESGVITWTQTVSSNTQVVVPDAVATMLGTYTVTVTPAENATYAAAYKSDGGAEITPANDVLTVTVGKTIVITATPAEGYEYAEAPTGWTLSEGVITIEVSEAGTVAIPEPTKTYPSYIDGDTAKGKYETWAEYAEISSTDFPDAEGTNKDAYLLNCKTDEVEAAKAAFKFTSISYDSEKEEWVTETTTSYNEREYNGTVTVTGYTDVGCTVGNENEAGPFFKAELK